MPCNQYSSHGLLAYDRYAMDMVTACDVFAAGFIKTTQWPIYKMPLKNRQQAIPGGFDWNQPETGFTFKSDVFITTRDAIIADRMRNPRHKLRVDPEHVEWEMEQRYIAKLKSMAGGDQWLVPEASDSPPPVFQRHRSRSEAVAVGLGKASQGIGIIREWLGDGLKPVAKELAAKRAEICVKCPQNVDGNWWQRFEGEVGKKIKSLVETKNGMQLTTPNDDKLKSCAVCDCWMQTKVWVPLSHIAAHTKTETINRLDPNCWILSESKS